MSDSDVRDYIDEIANIYYNPIMLQEMIEDVTGMTLQEIKDEVNRQSIVVNRQKIEDFLNKKFDEEKHDVKERIANRGPREYKRLDEMTLEDAKNDSERLSDAIVAYNYSYDPYTLEYFTRFVVILKQKLNILIDLIEKICDGDILPIQGMLEEFDIVLDENGHISDTDIVRLIPPLINNFNLLIEKTKQANNLNTYLNKITIESYFKGAIMPYPSEALQIKNVYANNDPGNIRLSERQIEQIRKQENEKIKLRKV